MLHRKFKEKSKDSSKNNDIFDAVQVSEMRQNLGLVFGDVLGLSQNLKIGFFTCLFGIFCCFNIFLGLGNESRVVMDKIKRLLTKKYNKLI